MARGAEQLANIRTEYFALKGGLDQVAPPLSLIAGACREALNFECNVEGGYTRISGYERYDGRPAPSTAVYWRLKASYVPTLVPLTSTVVGATSGATGKVAAQAGEYLILVNVTGTFVSEEGLTVGGIGAGFTSSAAVPMGADSQKQKAEYQLAAANIYRAAITEVPGSGAVRGVVRYKDVVYAFRDNISGTAGALWKATNAGWAQVDLGRSVSFGTGVSQIQVGDTIVGASSGATGVVKAIQVTSGTWGSNAAGRIFFNTITGTFSSGELLKKGATTMATATSASSAVNLQPGGTYRFAIGTFNGVAGTEKVYGCSGVDFAFEFDGTTFVQIRTGMTNDKPQAICIHRNYLWLSFESSLQHSSITDPLSWSAVTGAAEMSTGSRITDMMSHVGNLDTSAMLVFSEEAVHILYGSSNSDWKLTPYSTTYGALAGTPQISGDPFLLSRKGIVRLLQTQAYGGFDMATVSHKVHPFVDQRRGRATASMAKTAKNQYRVFFNDGYGLYLTFKNDTVVGMMPVLFPNPVRVAHDSMASDGVEYTYFGSDNGFVYQMDRGSNFDGQPVVAYLSLAFAHFKGPQTRKGFKSVAFEVDGDGVVEGRVSYELSYSSTDIPSTPPAIMLKAGGGSYWDSFTWDAFWWDSRSLEPLLFKIDGRGTNISFRFYTNSSIVDPFTVYSAIVRFVPTRSDR